jgi:hypothetical protein
MCDDNGRNAVLSRVAYGAIYAKEMLGLTDEGLVEQIAENVYLQYFLGRQEYQSKPMFDSSMMVHFRRRFTPKFVSAVSDYICLGKWPEERDPNEPPPPPDPMIEKKGTLQLDATVGESDVRYPNDVMLLDECRENLEAFIDGIWEGSDRQGHKTPYSRKKAHKKIINYIKKKRKSQSLIKAALNDQIQYVGLAIRQLVSLILSIGLDCLTERQWDRFDLICRVYLQQKEMYDNNTNRCEGKILNLRQPHVRAILRGKARSKYEYGQKLALSLVDGYAFVEKQSWDNFNEGITLQESVFRYYHRFGYFPEAILADQIYRTRDNVAFCKSYGIRLTGPKLGRKAAGQEEQEKKLAYQDSCKRNAIEGANGVLKRRYGLDLIMCILPHNAEVEAQLQILAMNLQRKLRLLLSFFSKRVVFGLFGLGCTERVLLAING